MKFTHFILFKIVSFRFKSRGRETALHVLKLQFLPSQLSDFVSYSLMKYLDIWKQLFIHYIIFAYIIQIWTFS